MIVECCCALARRFGDQLRGERGIEILNDVVLMCRSTSIRIKKQETRTP